MKSVQNAMFSICLKIIWWELAVNSLYTMQLGSELWYEILNINKTVGTKQFKCLYWLKYGWSIEMWTVIKNHGIWIMKIMEFRKAWFETLY